MQNATPIVPGCTLEVLKGISELWVQSTTGRPAHYARVSVRERLRVVEVQDGPHGFRVTFERAHDRFSLFCSSAAKTAWPEFNLNTGDPTKTIRVRVAKRPEVKP